MDVSAERYTIQTENSHPETVTFLQILHRYLFYQEILMEK